MSKEKDFDYEDLKTRGDLAMDMIMMVLRELDLFVSVEVNSDSSKNKVIFSDRTRYIENGEKRGVEADFKILNAVIFDDMKDIPNHIKEKHQLIDASKMRKEDKHQ